MDNHGCLKCRKVFAYHLSKDCPNDWPSPVNYRPVTAATGKAGRIRKNPAAAVVPTEAGPSLTIAAVTASHPVAYVAANMQLVIEDDNDDADSDDSGKVSNKYPLFCAAVISNTEIPISSARQVKR